MNHTLEAYDATRSKILTMMDYHGEPQSLINDFNQVIHVARKRFARYSVCATPCNEQCLGSSIAEANHSSYVGRIGGGSWDDPATQVKDCILRMQELSVTSTGDRLQQAATPRALKPSLLCLLSCQSADSRSVKNNTRNLQSTTAVHC